MDIKKYWDSILRQDKEELRKFFNDNALINWHNTNEQFNVEEFLIANCDYPGEWQGEIKKIINNKNQIICVVNVFSVDKKESFHVTSFIEIVNNKISLIDEYWGDDSTPPEWRVEKNIGKKIN